MACCYSSPCLWPHHLQSRQHRPRLQRWHVESTQHPAQHREQRTMSQHAADWLLLTTQSSQPLLTTRPLLHGILPVGVALTRHHHIAITFLIPAPTLPSPWARSYASLLQSCSPTAMGQAVSAPSTTWPVKDDLKLSNDSNKWCQATRSDYYCMLLSRVGGCVSMSTIYWFVDRTT